MDNPLLLLVALSVALLLVVVLLVLTGARRRREAQAARTSLMTTIETMDGHRVVDAVVRPAGRRSRGRHSAAPAMPSGVFLLVPVGAKLRRRPHEAGDSFMMPANVDVVYDVEHDEILRTETAAIAPPPPSLPDPAPAPDRVPERALEAAEDVDVYRRRVNATIQAMSRRLETGESPELVEERMLAAMARLDGPVGFARPALSPSGASAGQLAPASSTALPASRPGSVVPPVHEPAAEPPTAQIAPDRPIEPEPVVPDAPAAEPTTEPTATEPAPQTASVADDTEVVLPVPPIETSGDTTRRSRRRRGQAG
jgi:hypothetical protein